MINRIYACFIGLVALLLLNTFAPAGFMGVHTSSIPVGLYWRVDRAPGSQLDRGSRACFEYVAPAWARGRDYFPEGGFICKYVAAVPGDRIVITGDALKLCSSENNCRDAGYFVDKDRFNRPVVRADLPEVIPAGQYYLSGTENTRSYDSRYQGLIADVRIKRTLTPLITWN